MNTTPSTHTTPGPVTGLHRPALIAALAAALALAAATLWWWVAPDRSPFGTNAPDNPPLLIQGLVGGATAHLLVAALAVASAVTAGIALLRSSRVPAPAAGVLAAASVVVLLSPSMLASLGYTLAFIAPLAVVAGAVLVFTRYPRARIPVGAAVVAAAAALWLLDGVGVLAGVVATVGVAYLHQADGLIVLLVGGAALQASWVLAFAGAASGHRALAGATRWVTSHRRTLAYLAALGPLPYALARLTWLTPWPLLGDPGDDVVIRVWGLLLSLGAWGAIVLTLGLASGWGEVFPRWLPYLAGREVPPLAAILPGGLVAVMLTLEAVPFLRLGLGAEQGPAEAALMAVVFPLWYWGPLLALAVWGYAGHRAGVATATASPAGTQIPAPGNT